MEYFKLRNGIEIPAVGSGTNTFGRADDRYESPLNGDFTAMRSAIEVGYRMFDTAMAYGNEDGIGEEIAKSGIPRSEFFIMGKIPNRAPYNSSPENIRRSVEDSLKNLKTDYFDMFLIHKAVDEDYKAKLAAIGEKYGKHWAQVQLRYNFQSGIVSIPKSSNPKNQASNLNIFDFALTDEEMAQLS